MKKALVTALLIIVVVATAPVMTGLIAKREFLAQLSQVNELPDYFAVLEEYQQGWWGASAVVRVGVNKQLLAKIVAESPLHQNGRLDKFAEGLRLDMEIAHGPLFFAGGIGTGLMRVSGLLNLDSIPGAKTLRQKAGIHSFLYYETITDLSGNSSFHANSPAFRLTGDDTPYSRFSFGGLSLQGHHFSENNTVSLQLEMPASSFAGQTARVVFEPAVVRGEVVAISSRPQSGDISVQWDGLKLYKRENSESKPDLQVDDVKLLLRTKKDNDNTIKMHIDYAVKDLIAMDNKIENLHLTIDFERIGIDGIDRFYNLYRELKHRENHAGGIAWRIQQVLAGSGSSFLRHSPVLTVSDFRFYYNGDQCNAYLHAAVDGEGLGNGPIDDPMVLLRRLTVNARADASEALAREITRRYLGKQWMKTRMADHVSPQVIKNMAARQAGTFLEVQIQKGKLLKKGNGYQAVLSMQDGALLLNGEPVPIKEF